MGTGPQGEVGGMTAGRQSRVVASERGRSLHRLSSGSGESGVDGSSNRRSPASSPHPKARPRSRSRSTDRVPRARSAHDGLSPVNLEHAFSGARNFRTASDGKRYSDTSHLSSKGGAVRNGSRPSTRAACASRDIRASLGALPVPSAILQRILSLGGADLGATVLRIAAAFGFSAGSIAVLGSLATLWRLAVGTIVPEPSLIQR